MKISRKNIARKNFSRKYCSKISRENIAQRFRDKISRENFPRKYYFAKKISRENISRKYCAKISREDFHLVVLCDVRSLKLASCSVRQQNLIIIFSSRQNRKNASRTSMVLDLLPSTVASYVVDNYGRIFT